MGTRCCTGWRSHCELSWRRPSEPTRPAAAVGRAKGTTLSIVDILLATNARTVNGLLYDLDGSGSISNAEQALRAKANEVYSAINELGGI